MEVVKKVNKNNFTSISHDLFFTILRNLQKDGVNIITFHPIAIVKNCLPVPLEIKFASSKNPDFQL